MGALRVSSSLSLIGRTMVPRAGVPAQDATVFELLALLARAGWRFEVAPDGHTPPEHTDDGSKLCYAKENRRLGPRSTCVLCSAFAGCPSSTFARRLIMKLSCVGMYMSRLRSTQLIAILSRYDSRLPAICEHV